MARKAPQEERRAEPSKAREARSVNLRTGATAAKNEPAGLTSLRRPPQRVERRVVGLTLAVRWEHPLNPAKRAAPECGRGTSSTEKRCLSVRV